LMVIAILANAWLAWYFPLVVPIYLHLNLNYNWFLFYLKIRRNTFKGQWD
jgi:hypothetical protein